MWATVSSWFFLFLEGCYSVILQLHTNFNCCLREELSPLNTVGHLQATYQNSDRLKRRKDSYVVVTVVLAEIEMPTEWTSDHRNNKSTIQTFSLFTVPIKSIHSFSDFSCFIVFFSDTEDVFELFLTLIFKSENKSLLIDVKHKKNIKRQVLFIAHRRFS